MVRISRRLLLYLTISYLYLPIALFLFGWTKLWIASACCVALVFPIRSMLADYLSSAEPEKNSGVLMTPLGFMFVLLFLLLVGYYAGWGRWVEQSTDWQKHNLVLMDLTQKSWPVYYVNGDEHSMLSYYVAQYLLPAFVGKCFNSVRLAEIINYVWAEIGLILVYLNLVRIVQIKRRAMFFIAAFMLVFFSTPTLLAKFARWIVYPEMGLAGVIAGGPWFINEDTGLRMQYSGNFVLLRWVFPQTIAPWLTTLLFFEHRRKIRHYMTLFSPGLLFATLPLLGMVPLAVGQALRELVCAKKIWPWLKNLFSLENILVFCGLGMVSILYLYGNVTGAKPDIFGFSMMPYGNRMALYFIFVGICVLPYAAILYHDNRRNCVFYTSILTLCILPLFRMGLWNDLAMRSSIPSLFVLLTLSLMYLQKHLDTKPAIMLSLLLLIGSWYPLYGFTKCVRADKVMRLGNEIEFGQENKSLGTLGTYASRRAETSDMTYNYFCYDIERDFFYRHIARTHLPISCKAGVNHRIPFAEAEVDAKDVYKSHFMVDFLRRVTPLTQSCRLRGSAPSAALREITPRTFFSNYGITPNSSACKAPVPSGLARHAQCRGRPRPSWR